MELKANQRYESIQVMRGIAALSVVFMHVNMFQNGDFGVDLFFCISGFIMMHVTEKTSKNFLQKRAVRILPLYWLTTLFLSAVLILAPSVFRTIEFGVVYLIKSMLFIPYHFIGKNGSSANNLLQVGWTLILEVFFYIVFFISMKINHKYRHFIASIFLFGIVLTGMLIKSGNIFIQFIQLYSSPIMLEFTFGMFAYKLLVKPNVYEKKTRYQNTILAICAVLIWIGLFAEKYIPFFSKIDRLFKYGIPCFAFFIIIFILLENKRIPRAFVVLGDISYSLYLTHIFVVQGFSRLIYNIDDFSIPGVVLVFAVVIPAVILVAWVSWYLIENKLTGLLQKKLIHSKNYAASKS